MATESTLTVFSNSDTTLRIDVVTEDGGATPQTMTGWALQFVIRKAEDPGTGVQVVSYSTGSGITIGNGASTDDRATVSIVDTDLLHPPGRGYAWALWRSDSGSDVPLAHGQCVIKRAAAQV